MSDGNELQREDLVAALAELPLATRESDIGLDRSLEACLPFSPGS
jgi:hypothetical protein